MPRRTTRTSQASGSSEAPLVLSGDEDGVAPPRRLPREESDRLRDMELTFKLRMYDYASSKKNGSFSDRFPLHFIVFKQVSAHIAHEANVEEFFSRAVRIASRTSHSHP